MPLLLSTERHIAHCRCRAAGAFHHQYVRRLLSVAASLKSPSWSLPRHDLNHVGCAALKIGAQRFLSCGCTRPSNGCTSRPPFWKSAMFGYRTEERLELRLRARWQALKTWPFLSELDLRAVHSPSELSHLIALRMGISVHAARSTVASWLKSQRHGLATKYHLSTGGQRRSTLYPPQKPDW
jgi:hypothetical protein